MTDTTDELDAAVVIGIASGRCRVFHRGREHDCVVPSEIAARQKSTLAVGDRVIAERSDGIYRIAAILPRRTLLARPDPANPHRQRLIAANIDRVLHVVSVRKPPLRPGLIDRTLIAIQRGGARPLICVNKIDLVAEVERAGELAPLEVYRALEVPVIACSARTGEGLDALRTAVRGMTCALVGHSGVGKSSILNALDQRLQLATGDLQRRGTGRHTTTSSTLHDLGEGTLLIDTPGIRQFGLWDLHPETLPGYFPEFLEAATHCRFNDCSHQHEPQCEVKRRAASGEISAARYSAYLRLAEDLARGGR